MATLGDVFLNVVYAENPRKSVTTSDHPIEDGESIVDHIERQPVTMSISGIVTGDDAGVRLQKLKEYMDNGEQLEYIYRNWLSNVIITDLDTTHDSTVDKAFKFNMTLKNIRIAQSSAIAELDVPQKVQVAEVKNKGRKQTKDKSKQAASLSNEETALLKEMGDL